MAFHRISNKLVLTSDLEVNGAISKELSLGNNKITNLAYPTANQDAASKLYVDSVAQGLVVKDSSKVATVTPISNANTSIASASFNAGVFSITTVAPGILTFDGYTVTLNDRILVKNQATTAQNGIYYLSSAISGTTATLTRSTDFDTAVEAVTGAFTLVLTGSTYASTGWVVTSPTVATLNSDPIVWSQFSGAGLLTPGLGLSQVGTDFNINGSTTITVNNSDNVIVQSSNVTGQVLRSLGAVGTEAQWGALDLANSSAVTNALPVVNGGTGLSSLPATSFMVTDGLGALGGSKAIPAGEVIGTYDAQTLTNKSLVDATTLFIDELDNTKKMQFQLSGITTGQTRTLTAPNASGTIVLADAAQTLTNKTIDTVSTILSGSNVGTVSLDLTAIAANQTLVVPNTAGGTSVIVLDTATQTLTNKTLTTPVIASLINGGGGTVTFTSGTYTVVGDTVAANLTNKAFEDASTTFYDNADPTKIMRFELSSLSAGTSILRLPSVSVSTYELILNSGTQTLYDKIIDTASNTINFNGKKVNPSATPQDGSYLRYNAATGEWVEQGGTQTGAYLFDDFISSSLANMWVEEVVGTGYADIIAGVGGVVEIQTSNGASDSTELRVAHANYSLASDYSLAFRVRLENTANIQTEFGVYSDANNYVRFNFSSATTFWRCQTSNGTANSVTTTYVGNTSYQVFEIVATDTPSNSIKFYIDGALVATMTTNLSTAVMNLFIKQSTVATTQRSSYVDYIETTSSRV